MCSRMVQIRSTIYVQNFIEVRFESDLEARLGMMRPKSRVNNAKTQRKDSLANRGLSIGLLLGDTGL